MSDILICLVVWLVFFVSAFIIASLSSSGLCDAEAESIDESSCDNGSVVTAILLFGLPDDSSESLCPHVLVFLSVSVCTLSFFSVFVSFSPILALISISASEAVSVVSLSLLLSDLRNESSESL